MKNLFVFFSAVLLTVSSCADDSGNPPKDGEDQVPQPVENIGPDIEGKRAVEATVNDPSKSDERSDTTDTPRKDSTK